MSITVTTDVFCDYKDCERYCGVSGKKLAARSARSEAKSQGWTRMDGKDYCPTHKPTRVTALTFPVAE